MIVYFNSKFLHKDDVKVSPFDRAYLFADGAYEALRSYNQKLFRLNSHLKRLKHSLTELSILFSGFNDIKTIAEELVKKNNINSDYSFYIQISRGISFPRTHHFASDITPNVFAFVKPIVDNRKQREEGVPIILEKDLRWLRCDIKSISILPAVMVSQKAFSSGVFEAVLYRDNFITEGSHTSFFAVKNNTIYTTPLSNYILDGITRKVVLELCKENQIEYKEENIKVDELKTYDEFFITGTTTEVTPVIKIDDWFVNNGKPGVVTRNIQKLFNIYTENFNE
ncbi:MAG TPA: D-amino-acid transaminase [Ignavibacteriaceae bacterium]|jgi:D-alanine transaminase|nr:MAG: D-alanine aminotransferase [Ignavibacteria bacterium ADurb.Bin266]OQY72795.1 MAG: D-amino-acid transaminase [Ignavibacteriales bacterium UTCHB2]HQF41752.1 D-amino-acid transaminase [Ignavibacteriaceae bacterium]HQI41185.1 D-amino-acid transaminase [Ignavibacteriaceae bacterium]HQJ45069.1 D-amino-acid transaminase [Ignavibacteriaceae bacterium]